MGKTRYRVVISVIAKTVILYLPLRYACGLICFTAYMRYASRTSTATSNHANQQNKYEKNNLFVATAVIILKN